MLEKWPSVPFETELGLLFVCWTQRDLTPTSVGTVGITKVLTLCLLSSIPAESLFFINYLRWKSVGNVVKSLIYTRHPIKCHLHKSESFQKDDEAGHTSPEIYSAQRSKFICFTVLRVSPHHAQLRTCTGKQHCSSDPPDHRTSSLI